MNNNNGSSSSNTNPNNPSSPNNNSPRRGGENINTPPRSRSISVFLRPPTSPLAPPRPPPPPPSPSSAGPPSSGSHPNPLNYLPEGMAQGASAIPVGGSGGPGVVGTASSLAGRKKRVRTGKKAVVVAESSGGGSEDNRRKCSICQKVFASERALFGHMHLHRDRGWKGAHPPPTFNVEEEFADVPGVNRAAGGDEAAAAAAREAEEAAAVAAVEQRRGIRIDLNVDVTEEGSDDADED